MPLTLNVEIMPVGTRPGAIVPSDQQFQRRLKASAKGMTVRELRSSIEEERWANDAALGSRDSVVISTIQDDEGYDLDPDATLEQAFSFASGQGVQTVRAYMARPGEVRMYE